MLGDYAWFSNNSGKETHPVGEKKPNAFGLFDMHGNVWQWTEDCWNESYENAPGDGLTNAAGNCEERVLRGGSWGNDPQLLRAARRIWGLAEYRYDFVGFRVARTTTISVSVSAARIFSPEPARPRFRRART
jgi:formylglycine-generating enzyme required for sulfatase activity